MVLYKISPVFCFASIGNFFTREEKIKVLELMHELFNNNYNKNYFYLTHSQEKIYGMETTIYIYKCKNKILFLNPN